VGVARQQRPSRTRECKLTKLAAQLDKQCAKRRTSRNLNCLQVLNLVLIARWHPDCRHLAVKSHSHSNTTINIKVSIRRKTKQRSPHCSQSRPPSISTTLDNLHKRRPAAIQRTTTCQAAPQSPKVRKKATIELIKRFTERRLRRHVGPIKQHRRKNCSMDATHRGVVLQNYSAKKTKKSIAPQLVHDNRHQYLLR